MKIQINTDKNIEGTERLENYYTEEIEKVLHHFDSKITRIEVHFSDENSSKNGMKDKRCLIEVRLENMQPKSVSNVAETTEKAFKGALNKIYELLISTFEKMRNY